MKATDLRGAARLATDATTALTDIVEAMHWRIARVPGGRAERDGRTAGITGLVYRSVRGATRVVGGSFDALLGAVLMALPRKEIEDRGAPGARREAIVAALNGVLGDHLAASHNPLAITMAFRSEGRALTIERSALMQRLPGAGGDVLVLLHGLCMNDLQWQRDGHDHGAALARDLGFTPVYLHYNSGLHISSNGRELAAQLQGLLDAWPCPVRRVVLVGHSMGGLLARSALHYGRQAHQGWVAKVSDLVCLGTPHHGAPLERIGHWVETVLGRTPFAGPLARLGKVRSSGITDLRHGYLCDEDWQAEPGSKGRGHQPVPLPRDVRCFALAASTGKHRADLKGRLIGDGLVPVHSALGQHKDPALTLRFKPQHQSIEWSTNHLGLLSSPGVLAQLQRWLRPPPRSSPAAIRTEIDG
jgi:pimeloyl-ACP methyl ester carboxylesterase